MRSVLALVAAILAALALQQTAFAMPEPRESTAWPGPDAIRLPRVVAGELFTVRVPVVNDGAETLSSWTGEPVRLAYHWLDPAGRPAVWDGLRTPLLFDLAPGAERPVSAIVRPPAVAGAYTLVFDLVREGVGWLGKTVSAPATVEAPLYRALLAPAAAPRALVGSTRTLALSLTNTGNVTWRAAGASPTLLSYHWYDASGKRVLEWDGARTPLAADVAPGASASVSLAVRMPSRVGDYTLAPDLVRDGIGWFSSGPQPEVTVAMRATTDLDADWQRTSTPEAITPGAHMPVDVVVANAGLRRWNATGPDAARVSYHWFDADGRATQWDGARFPLAADVAPGEHASLLADVVAPSAPGVYTLEWDVVSEGVGWASQQSGEAARDTVVVEPGVTLYGKGWGHGVGLSQWGAQGWAEGAAGPRLTGEEIVAKYYPGTEIATLPADAAPIRVLLSEPSTACVERSISSVAHIRSAAGLRLVREADESSILALVPPGQTLRAISYGWGLSIVNADTGAWLYDGWDDVGVFSQDPAHPMDVDEKGLAYRDKLVLESGNGGLRVVNDVTPQEYMRGSLPGEMPARWEMEALRAQAMAGLSFALWRQSGMHALPYDIRDDTTDQCYGGAGFESPRTDAAVASTAGRYLTYGARPIRAYYTSSNGGETESNACVWDVDRSRGGMACGAGEPYLRAAPDPADLAASDAKGANMHRLWSATFTGSQLRWLAYDASGVDIGDFVSIDLSNRSEAGYVMSVKITGTYGTVELRGGSFLRGELDLQSSLVRLEPF